MVYMDFDRSLLEQRGYGDYVQMIKGNGPHAQQQQRHGGGGGGVGDGGDGGDGEVRVVLHDVAPCVG